MTDPTDSTPPTLGTPDWWAASREDTDAAHRSGRGRPPLPLDEILTEALSLLAEHGLDGLGIRALARRLGSSTSTLYRQLPGGKDELCTRLAEHVMTEIVTGIAASGLDDEWSATIEQSAVVSFDVLRRHPYAASLFAGQVQFGPMGLLRYELSLRLLLAAGFSPTDAAAADHALARLIVGYALQSPREESPSRATLAEYYRRLDAAEYPSIATAIPALPEDLRAEFVFALQTFVAGLRRRATEIHR
ncbi:TetR/AcrR family transcriptional regulator [Gordonia sp. CPCC 206044]|uniref:TetR/AcrR family transcriptional regulator n=1 Tax=Gordonia sp. CPCC 206044 TaxID=3140793 RepID=UPI003AF3B000